MIRPFPPELQAQVNDYLRRLPEVEASRRSQAEAQVYVWANTFRVLGAPKQVFSNEEDARNHYRIAQHALQAMGPETTLRLVGRVLPYLSFSRRWLAERRPADLPDRIQYP